MTIRSDIIQRLWRGSDPFAAVLDQAGRSDIQGWNSDHSYLTDAIDQHRPEVVVEVGVWKGAATITMASEMRAIGAEGVVIAVDTWLGSAEHWLDPQVPRRPDGTSMLYDVFLENILLAGLQDYVVPLPLDSASASTVMTRLDIRPTVIHIDAAHDFWSCRDDLSRWWKLLAPGGTMIVDDYNNAMWPDVHDVVNNFRASVPSIDWAECGAKCRFRKPPAGHVSQQKEAA